MLQMYDCEQLGCRIKLTRLGQGMFHVFALCCLLPKRQVCLGNDVLPSATTERADLLLDVSTSLLQHMPGSANGVDAVEEWTSSDTATAPLAHRLLGTFPLHGFAL